MRIPYLPAYYDFLKDGRLYNRMTAKYRKPSGSGTAAKYQVNGYNINILYTLAELYIPKMMSAYDTVVWTGEAMHADCVYWVRRAVYTGYADSVSHFGRASVNIDTPNGRRVVLQSQLLN